MPSENSDSLIPKPSAELSVGSGAERVLSEMTGDALKIHEQSLKPKSFKIGDVELCEPDYQFIVELAKRTEKDEKELLDEVVGIGHEREYFRNWNGYETIKEGRLTRIICENQIRDLTPLSGLTQLERLHLSENQITDVSPLANLTQLKILYLHQNQITDVSPLSNLTKLEVLCLVCNKITDVSPLSCLTKLEELLVGKNQITDISPLSNLTKLEQLHLSQIR